MAGNLPLSGMICELDGLDDLFGVILWSAFAHLLCITGKNGSTELRLSLPVNEA
jgi:hypothetical protein